MATCGLCKTSQDSTHVRNNYARRYAGIPYCASPTDETGKILPHPVQCQATTKSGSRCKKMPINNSGFCSVHSWKERV